MRANLEHRLNRYFRGSMEKRLQHGCLESHEEEVHFNNGKKNSGFYKRRGFIT